MSEWAYTETPSGQKATNMRTGEVWYRWGSDQLYHPTREPAYLIPDSPIALIISVGIILAICIGITYAILYLVEIWS